MNVGAVDVVAKEKGFLVGYVVVNSRGKKIVRKFLINDGGKKNFLTKELLYNLMRKIVKEKKEQTLFTKQPREIKSELVRYLNKVSRSTKRGDLLNKYGWDVRKEEGEIRNDEKEEGVEGEGKPHRDLVLPSKSMFAAEKESANTKVFLAPSFSGKTTLIVNELNKLTKTELEEYDMIYFFTESTSSAPLKALSENTQKKVVIYDRFLPQFVTILKKINTVTGNRFRFLLILDDCIRLKGNVLIRMILTFRNANISTVISIQYSKLLDRSQRCSIHDYYIINLKIEDLEYLMSGFLASHFRELFEREGLASHEQVSKWNYKQLAERARERLKGKILHFNQREEKIEIFEHQKK
jgi:hypothetical protein